MSKSISLNIITLLALIALSSFVFLNTSKPKQGFVYTKKVFDNYHGKKEFEKKLSALREKHHQELEPLRHQINQDENNQQLINSFQVASQHFQVKEEELSQKYTSDIWKQINQYLVEYGKEQGYEFIFGASGDGNLMFAHDANDISEEIILYINTKYEGE